MKYYLVEGTHYNVHQLGPVFEGSLEEAKNAAVKNCIFQGTFAVVKSFETEEAICCKKGRGRWVNL